MHTFSPRHGLLPLTPYEPARNDATPPVVVPADGQLTIEDALTDVPAQRSPAARRPHLDRQRIHRVLTALLEVRGGRRPATQLATWVTPALLRTIRARAQADGPRYRLRQVHACHPSDAVVEVCATADTAGRARAVAARFEHGPAGWRCIAFAVV